MSSDPRGAAESAGVLPSAMPSRASPRSCVCCQRSAGFLRETRVHQTVERRGASGRGGEGRRIAARGWPRRAWLWSRRECALSGQHFVEHCAKRKQIGARVGFLAAHLFRRHVRDRADERPVERQRARRPGGTRLPARLRRRPNRASPKSSSFTPDFVSMMLAGFRSRWTMPRAWAAASASTISTRDLERLIDWQRLPAAAGCERLPFQQLHHEIRHLTAAVRRGPTS